MNRRAMFMPFRTLAAAVLPLLLAACGGATCKPPSNAPLEGATIGGPFTLKDSKGKDVRWSDFQGNYRIVYFGYTFCPDACPMDVQVMSQGFAQFEKEEPELAKYVQPIFISIDPARDTPEIVGEFTAAFHPRLRGLTGTEDEVGQAAKAFATYYAKGKESAGGYLMDHGRAAYLMGCKGEPLAILPVQGPKSGPGEVAAELKKWVR